MIGAEADTRKMRKRTPPDDKTLEMPKRNGASSRLGAKSSTPVQTPKKRHARRRRDWNPIVRSIALVALLVELGLIVFANPYLRVTKVRVDGAQTLSPAQVFEQARVPARTNIFWMALHQPFAQRLDADPVVDHATRRIQLPDTLVLRIWERQPFATLALDRRYWLLDAQGVPFRVLSKPYPGVPLVVPMHDTIQGQALDADTVALGKRLHTDWLRHSYQLIALVAPDRNLVAAKIEVDQNGNLCLNRQGYPRILLGQPDSLSQKVALVQAALAADGGAIRQHSAYIDVSCLQQPAFMPLAEAKNKSLRSD